MSDKDQGLQLRERRTEPVPKEVLKGGPTAEPGLGLGQGASSALSAVLEQPPGPHPARWHHQPSVPHEDRAGPAGHPQLLLYSGTQELQTLAARSLRVAMLDQQIHLQKVLAAQRVPGQATANALDCGCPPSVGLQ